MSMFIGLLLATATLAKTPVLHIGTHYTDGLAGLTFYQDAKHSLLLDFTWQGTDTKAHRGYKALMDAKVHFQDAAPDDSYHRISWTAGRELSARDFQIQGPPTTVRPTIVTYEWGLIGNGRAVGRITSSYSTAVCPRFVKAWFGRQSDEISSTNHFSQKLGDILINFNAFGFDISFVSHLGGFGRVYSIGPSKPLQFSIGVGRLPEPKQAGKILDAARGRYQSSHLWAEGDWGDFLSPIEDQLGNSKIYSADTGRLAHIVSRNWCLPDGQVLFCWDSFFNGLMSSLEDPAAARNTIRALFAGAPPTGFVPNFSGRGWGVSSDRSQPPVGSYCVWKMNQRDPDVGFLREVYPKLLKWHKWWFKHRDGNHDGLLEWGTETGELQNAKFESGLDDSPMFDDGKMHGPNMDLDATDLNGLYAMDADYLAKIAEKIGMKDDASNLKAECADMARRMNAKLWNDALGAYCYRYWTPQHAVEPMSSVDVFTAEGQPGLLGEYFEGRELKGAPQIRHDADINFDWAKGPMDGFGQNDYSARWTADFVAPKTGLYEFEAASDDGCRVWIDDKKIIDGWSIHGSTKYVSPPSRFTAGEKHKFRMEYFQAEGGATVSLAVHRIESEKPGIVFSPRLSPLNFYPLIVGAPSRDQGRRTLDLFFRNDRFGGKYVCPTISRNDPAYPHQGYWRGTIWGPTSYLTYQGLRRYATGSELIDYAEKSVKLFMKNWNNDGSCHENFNAITGWGRSDPHYTWGALLCLVGLEQLCDTAPDGKIILNGNSGRHIKIHNLRIGGKIYDVAIEPHKAMLSRGGKTVIVVRGEIKRLRI